MSRTGPVAVLLAALSAGSRVIAAPGELSPSVRFADRQTLTWAPEAGAASYNVYKGLLTVGSWQYHHECLALDLTTTSFVDAATPTPAHIAYYLVSQEDAAGNEGVLGFAPGGAPIPPGTCTDIDADGVADDLDNCPDWPNPDQLDFDQDRLGDACDPDDDNDGLEDTVEAALGTNPFDADSDNDGFTDGDEVLILGTDPLSGDTDGDGHPDPVDNCRRAPNPTQQDVDADTVGDACDNCPTTSNQGQENADHDRVGDVCEQHLVRNVIAPGGSVATRSVVGQSAAGVAMSPGGAILLIGFMPQVP